MSDKNPMDARGQEQIKDLLARVPVITSPCELDLLVFLYRHPYALLTNDQLAAFVGYDMKQVAKSIDAFIDAALLERTQNPTHTARMYRLKIEGPVTGGLQALLKLASTAQGRRDILAIFSSKAPDSSRKLQASRRRLHAIA